MSFSVGYERQDLTHKTEEWMSNKTMSDDFFKAFKKMWKLKKT